MCWLAGAGAVRALQKEVHELKGLLVERTERTKMTSISCPTAGRHDACTSDNAHGNRRYCWRCSL